LLTRHFIERLSHELGKEVGDITESALKLLLDYDWPGNVRKLENAVERAIVTCRTGVLAEDDFAFLNHNKLERRGWAVPNNMKLEEVEKEVVAATLQRAQGNIKEAAATLGIDRSTLYEKIKKYNIER
jgi:DNA-binding NtrC family response regulator